MEFTISIAVRKNVSLTMFQQQITTDDRMNSELIYNYCQIDNQYQEFFFYLNSDFLLPKNLLGFYHFKNSFKKWSEKEISRFGLTNTDSPSLHQHRCHQPFFSPVK